MDLGHCTADGRPMNVAAFDQGGQVFLILCQSQGLMRPHDDDDVVSGGEIALKQPDGFAQHAFGAIAPDGGADPA